MDGVGVTVDRRPSEGGSEFRSGRGVGRGVQRGCQKGFGGFGGAFLNSLFPSERFEHPQGGG